MHAHVDVSKGKVRERKNARPVQLRNLEKSWPQTKDSCPAALQELQAPGFHTAVKEERRHGPSCPSVMAWFGWFQNIYQKQNFAIIVLNERETTFCSAGI